MCKTTSALTQHLLLFYQIYMKFFKVYHQLHVILYKKSLASFSYYSCYNINNPKMTPKSIYSAIDDDAKFICFCCFFLPQKNIFITVYKVTHFDFCYIF